MKPNALQTLVRALLAFGPLFIVMGLRMEPPLLAYAGSVMLSVGLMVQFRMSTSALVRLQQLEAQRAEGSE